MEINIKILTHESIIHTQITSIEKLLNRQVAYQLKLNVKGTKSNIEFKASQDEVERMTSYLGYPVYVLRDDEWIVNS
jgi:hypothetical protein